VRGAYLGSTRACVRLWQESLKSSWVLQKDLQLKLREFNGIESIEEKKKNRTKELDCTKSGDPPQSYPTAAPRLEKADDSANGDLRSSAIAADSAYLNLTTFPNLKECGHDLLRPMSKSFLGVNRWLRCRPHVDESWNGL
jgi:hypothetical protein